MVVKQPQVADYRTTFADFQKHSEGVGDRPNNTHKGHTANGVMDRGFSIGLTRNSFIALISSLCIITKEAIRP
jgi:hypothetical protein